MQLNEATRKAFLALAEVRNSVYIYPGTFQKSFASDQCSCAFVTLPQAMPSEFGSYDTNQFMTNLDILGDHDVEFGKEAAIIRAGDAVIKYNHTDIKLFQPPAPSDDEIAEVDARPHSVEFKLPGKTLEQFTRLSLNNGFTHIEMFDDGKHVKMRGFIKGDDSSNEMVWTLSPSIGKAFKSTIKRDNSNILATDYLVQVVDGGLVKFTAENLPFTLKYLIFEDANKE